MRNTRSVFLKELRTFFNSPMAYIFLIIFAVINGYFFVNTFFLFNQSDMRSLFNIVPLIYLFFVPAVSMGLIAREKNIGTIELIDTLPMETYEFVLGKFLAAFTLILLGLLATVIHLITLMYVGTNIDYGAVLSGYLGLAFVGAVYSAVGTFASSVTENQVVAFIIGVFLVLVFFLMDWMLVFIPVSIAGVVQFLSINFHLSNISRGVMDSRNIIYFISLIGFFLYVTIRTLDARKWG
ncbi:MAG: ABC transporter permease [Fidelibacterota bacterium]